MTIPAAEPRSLLRRLYDWCVEAAHKPRALWTMSGVAFAESSFFPVPPDVMLIPMALARPDRAYVMAAWCTIASVAGAPSTQGPKASRIACSTARASKTPLT